MLTKRIIACLDVRSGRVVKGVQFVDLVDAGDPAQLAGRHAAARGVIPGLRRNINDFDIFNIGIVGGEIEGRRNKARRH